MNEPARRGRASPSSSPAQDPSAPAERDITDEAEVLKAAPEQIEAIRKALAESGVELAAFLAKAEITDLAELAASDAPKAVEWIRTRKKAA